MRIRRTVDTMVTAGARGQVCAVHSEASEDAGAHQGLPHPQQHQAQAD